MFEIVKTFLQFLEHYCLHDLLDVKGVVFNMLCALFSQGRIYLKCSFARCRHLNSVLQKKGDYFDKFGALGRIKMNRSDPRRTSGELHSVKFADMRSARV